MKTSIFAALLVLASVLVPAQAQEPVAGRDYIEIPNGRPLEPAEGMVVVEEFFNYICPACNAFEPVFVAWQAKQPAYVKVVHVPATFRADFVPYAKAYYAAQALGLVEKTHRAVYEAIHIKRAIPAEGDRPDEEKIAAFYAGFGVSKDEFLSAMRSFGVLTKVNRATEHMQKSRVPATPTLVVNGRYMIRGATWDDSLRIASFLIEKERARTAAASSG
ncbi:MAG TPA: thiol:disulfide interchange protein DsbA/DsbL [Gammaproteobacteria bacterium]|nr:thiol:disulfide interchange protein DsbA/DsbL [Gammaproteobacteria bacterium]